MSETRPSHAFPTVVSLLVQYLNTPPCKGQYILETGNDGLWQRVKSLSHNWLDNVIRQYVVEDIKGWAVVCGPQNNLDGFVPVNLDIYHLTKDGKEYKFTILVGPDEAKLKEIK